MHLEDLNFISKTHIKDLASTGIYDAKDLITFYPYRYQILNPDTLENKEDTLTLNANVLTVPIVTYIKRNLNVLRFKVLCQNKILNVSIFNRSFLKKNLTVNKEIILVGKYNKSLNSFTASEIKMGVLSKTEMIPVYHTVKNIKNNTLRKYIKTLLETVSYPDELQKVFQEK